MCPHPQASANFFMAFATFEDESGRIEGIIFPKNFQEFEELLGSSYSTIEVTGTVSLCEEPSKICPTEMKKS